MTRAQTRNLLRYATTSPYIRAIYQLVTAHT